MMALLWLCWNQAAAAPQSWKQIAWQALMEGNRARAIEYYEKWADADPTDAISLYNLACCYALDGRTEDALKTIQKSADAGWSDSTHALLDPDLKSLRQHAEFSTVLAQMASNARLHGAGYTSNTVLQERIGRYVVILPEDYDPQHSYPLVVLLHGYGMSPETFADVAKYIDTQDYIYIVPEGPYTAMDSDGKGFSHLRETEDYQEDVTSAPATAEWIVRAADDAMRRYPINSKKFWIVGFSQGAAIAHVTAARYPDRIAGYTAHGGYIIKDAISEEQLADEKKTNVHIFITHGQDDPAVNIAEGVYASNMLKHAGLDVTFEMLDVQHVFSPEVGVKVGAWLKQNMK
jgi:phospholipase/carboxylesterase